MWPWPAKYNPLARAQAAYNEFFGDVKTTSDNATSAVVQTKKETGQAVQQWTIDNRDGLLKQANDMKVVGDNTFKAGVVMAAMGAPVAGVGAAPGGAVASTGEAISTTGAFLEIGVELVSGNYKNASLNIGSEVRYTALNYVRAKAIDTLIPFSLRGLDDIIDLSKMTLTSIENLFKQEADETIEKLKSKDDNDR